MSVAEAGLASEDQRDGRHARWDHHREQRRRLILDAAIAVVEEAPQGAELRLQDVATRAGLVRTVVQRHFGGQVGLLRAVQADVLDQAFALIAEPLDPTRSLHEVAAQMV
jgi:AcrR family transcriptional regulator